MNKFSENKKSITQIINKRKEKLVEVQKEKEIIEETIKQQIMTDEILNYHMFRVNESGLYNISNQLTLKALKANEINFIQYGLCKLDFDDYSKCFNSHILNTKCEKDYLLTHTLSTVKKLESNIEYVLWCFLDADNNKDFEIQSETSNLMLIKV